VKRVALAICIALAAVNIWTGGPAFALWVGSRAQGSGPATMLSAFVVIVVLAAVSLGLVRLIGALQRAYDECAGRGATVRAHTPWLRSMRGERPVYPGEKASLTAPERILIIVTVVAVLAFEVWFLFFSGSPFDQRSGRGQAPMEPPAIAGRITTVSPEATPVCRPSWTRTSSSFTYTFTKRFSSPSSANSWPWVSGCLPARPFRTSPTVAPSTSTSLIPLTAGRSTGGILTVAIEPETYPAAAQSAS
jgi:hypothetical protein